MARYVYRADHCSWDDIAANFIKTCCFACCTPFSIVMVFFACDSLVDKSANRSQAIGIASTAGDFFASVST